jgi:phospholipid/cholesterol/gamma-HCH transport system substrate-binding protein
MMSRSLSPRQAFILGFSVLLALGLGVFGLFAVGSRQWLWGDRFHVRVGFQQIQGVEVGTPVRILGRNAGEVESVELPTTPTGPVMLRLRLDGKLRQLVRADATAQVVTEGMVGGKVVELTPGSDAAAALEEDAVIKSLPGSDLAAVTRQVEAAVSQGKQAMEKIDTILGGVSKGDGSLGKLVKDDAAYAELVRSIKQVKGTMASLKEDADALKQMPIVRGYVRDAHKLLVHPECVRHRSWFREADLFEPGQAILTADGRRRLDELVPWIEGFNKEKGSDVAVAAYASADAEPDFAQALTQKQSEAVCDYLMNEHRVHKLGWFSRRKVSPIGLGVSAPPTPEKEPLPAPRVEVLVFVPAS